MALKELVIISVSKDWIRNYHKHTEFTFKTKQSNLISLLLSSMKKYLNFFPIPFHFWRDYFSETHQVLEPILNVKTNTIIDPLIWPTCMERHNCLMMRCFFIWWYFVIIWWYFVTIWWYFVIIWWYFVIIWWYFLKACFSKNKMAFPFFF